MSLTGMLLDVSGSMKNNIDRGVDEQGGPWARSIFKVIDDLIEHDLTSENRVFAIGVGADCTSKIFDIIGTLQEIQKLEKCSGDRNRGRINEMLDILETNGARNIRQWVQDITLIENEISEKISEVALKELQCNEKFRKTFVNEFLPSGCREIMQPIPFLNWAEDSFVWVASRFKPATREGIHEVVEKAKRYILKDVEIAKRHFLKTVGRHSIFSVQDASRIIHGCVDENELTTERMNELLENIEPFIYGGTPLYASLEEAKELFKTDKSENKMLFVLSDGEPADGSIDHNSKLFKQITDGLSEAHVKVVSCFVTRSTDISPKRLYDAIQPGWESGAKFLFSLSSHVPTQHLPRAIMAKRRWKIDIANNETKLFIQVNHPDNLRDACELAEGHVCNSEALSKLLVSVNLDIYISQTNRNFKAKNQGNEKTCYAFATAAVLHMAMQRIYDRDGGHPTFEELKNKMIDDYGKNGASMKKVLDKMCEEYRLAYCKVPIEKKAISAREEMSTEEEMSGKKKKSASAKEAISEKRPVIATFRLTNEERNTFKKFYEANPFGILTRKELDVRKRPVPCPELFGHAVVLTSYNSKCLTFMNSFGDKWADSGFFHVENAVIRRGSVEELVLGKMKFFDVYWDPDKLSEKEKESYRKSDSEAAAKLIKLLKGLEFAKYMCPECQQESLVTEFTGTLSKVQCPKCFREFSTNDNEGNILALNIYLISLSR